MNVSLVRKFLDATAQPPEDGMVPEPLIADLRDLVRDDIPLADLATDGQLATISRVLNVLNQCLDHGILRGDARTTAVAMRSHLEEIEANGIAMLDDGTGFHANEPSHKERNHHARKPLFAL